VKSQNSNQKKSRINFPEKVFFSLIFFLFCAHNSLAADMELGAFVTNNSGQPLNGELTIRFSIYSQNRTDQSQPIENSIWQEEKVIKIKNGILKTSLGDEVPLPNFTTNPADNYYLGIKIGDDQEMVPRRKIPANFWSVNALNALQAQTAISLRGASIGTNAGDIAVLAAGGQFDKNLIPKLTKLGAITTGTWQATRIDSQYLDQTPNFSTLTIDTALPLSSGGTGLKNLAQGDLLYYQTGDKLSALNIGAENQVLTISGGLPSWKNSQVITYTKAGTLLQLIGNTFSLKEGTLVDGRLCTYSATSGLVCNTEPSSGGVETDPVFSAHIANTITSTNLTNWNTAYNSRINIASSPLSFVSNTLSIAQANGSTSGYLSSSDWSTFNSKLASSLTSGYLFVGNASNVATAVAMSGDIAINSSGVTSIQANKITEPMLLESTGNPTNGNILTYNSSTQGFTWVATAPGTAHPLLSSTHSDTDSSATLAQGDILYYTGTQWTRLSAGINGQFLKTQGSGANPVWDTASGTTYSAGGTLLQLSGNIFSLKEGTLTSGRVCTYDATNGLVCDTDSTSIGHAPLTLGSPANGLSLNGQELSIATASSSTTGVLTSSDWSTFNSKLASSLTSGYLFVGNASNVATAVAMSGDIAINSSGVTSIQANKITEPMLLESTGNPTNGNILTYNSSTQGFTWVATAPGTAHPLLSSTHSDTDSSATLAQGDILYYTGTQWTRLSAGINGQFLKTQGSGANPVWDTASGTTYSATNGLTLNSTTFELGGTLTKNTTVALGGYNFNFSGTGNIGIGTTSPGYGLDVRGSGAAGQVNAQAGLCINGVCKTSWTDAGIGGDLWTQTGSDIYYNTGNVGIGTNNPGATLQVNGNASFIGNIPNDDYRTQTTRSDFDSGTKSQTVVIGNGTGGSIVLDSDINWDNSFQTVADTSPFSWTEPAVADLDGDEDDDVLVCSASPANTIFYENVNGTLTVKASWKNGFFTSGLYSQQAPDLVDWDGDGDYDVVLGTYGDGIKLILNTGSANNPSWSPSPISLISVGINVWHNPAAADFNNDGYMDIVFGVYSGSLYYYQNNGNDTFTDRTSSVNLGSVDLGEYSTPTTIDYDNDGDYDLVVGNQNVQLYYIENTGTGESPSFASPILWGTYSGYNQITPDFGDWGNDGDQDLILGNNCSNPYFPLYLLEKITTYLSPGSFISSAIDTGQVSPDYTTFDWNATVPSGTEIKFRLRTADTEGGLSSATWYGPTGTGDYYTSSGQSINSTIDGKRYIQYQAYLSTTDNTKTPTLNDITINFSFYSSINIASNSRLGIGVSDPTEQLDIMGMFKVNGSGQVVAGDWLGNAINVGYGGTGATSFNSNYLLKGNGSDSILSSIIYDSGTNIGIGTTSPTYKLDVNGTIRGYGITDSSDIRLKKNITNLSPVLDKLLKLRGVTYNWNDDLGLTTDTQIGLIAQELEEQFPELVVTASDGYKSIQYGKLSVINLKAIQELDLKKADQADLSQLTLQVNQQGADLGNQITNLSIVLTGGLSLANSQIASLSAFASQNQLTKETLSFYSFDTEAELTSDLIHQSFDRTEQSFTGEYSGQGEYQKIEINLQNGLDLSQFNYGSAVLRLNFFLERSAEITDANVELGNAMDTQELQWVKSQLGQLKDGWNSISLPVSTGTKTGIIDWKNLDYFRIYFKASANQFVKIKGIGLEVASLKSDNNFAFNLNDLDLENNPGQAQALIVLTSKTNQLYEEFQAKTDQLNQLNDNLSALSDLINGTETMIGLAEKVINHENRIALLESQMALITTAGTVSAQTTFSTQMQALENHLNGYENVDGYLFDLDGNLKVKKLQAEEVVAGEMKAETLEVGSAVAGKATISAGTTEVLIFTEAAKEGMKVYLTNQGNNFNQILFYDEIVEGKSFKVKINQAVSGEIKFDWMIIK